MGCSEANTTGTRAPLRDRPSLLARDWGKKGSSGDKQRPSDWNRCRHGALGLGGFDGYLGFSLNAGRSSVLMPVADKHAGRPRVSFKASKAGRGSDRPRSPLQMLWRNNLVALPGYVDKELWTAFTEMRQSMGKTKPFTVYAAKLILYELQRIKDGGHDANAALRQSVLKGYADVYPATEKPITRAQRAQASETTAFLARQDEITSSPDVRAEVVRALKVVRHR